MVGYVHSIESFGTVDGPGIRLVVFLKGCPMRCLYCHNPDTWEMAGAGEMTVEQILDIFEKNRSFYAKGGITVTGGEPLLQIDFVIELFTEAKKLGIHTCLDTCGVTFQPDVSGVISKFDRLTEITDLVLMDLKHIDIHEHKKLTGHSNHNILAFTKYLDKKRVPVWIRHVVIPGITSEQSSLYQLGRFIGSLSNVKALDILPYHDMGKVKYKDLGLEYPLRDVRPLSSEEAIAARKIVLEGMRSITSPVLGKNCT